MPAKSEKQEKFMQAVAHNKSFAKKVGVPQSVGQEFTKSGGGMKKMNPGMMAMMKKKAGAKKMAMGGYADGGMPMVMKDGKKVPSFAADGQGKMAKGGGVKKMAAGGVAASKMGAVKTAAPSRDGVAVKGKTKGTMVKMAGGGKAKKYC
jgi:hypothetical protein